jgi:hypothetical protein
MAQGEDGAPALGEFFTQARNARAEWATQTGKAGELVQNTEMDLIKEGFGDQMGRMLLGSFGRKRRQVSNPSKAEQRARQHRDEMSR